MSLVDRSWGQQPICTGPTSVTNLLYDCWPDIHFTSLGLSFFLFYFSLLKKFYLFISQDKKGREIERERNINVPEKCQLVASYTPPTGDLAHNPGMCPGRESNWQHFSLQASGSPLSHNSQGWVSVSTSIITWVKLYYLHFQNDFTIYMQPSFLFSPSEVFPSELNQEIRT